MDKKLFPEGGKAPSSRAEKYEYVKSIMSDRDGAALAATPEKNKEDFLGKARVAYFFKNLVQFQLTKDPEYLQHVKALAQGVDADGGYLTPTEFRAQLVEDIQDKPFLRNLVTVIPMTSNSLELPTSASGGGGAGGGPGTQTGTSGTANTGGGGGGSAFGSGTGSAGGSGVVIVRYPTADAAGYVCSGTTTTTGSDTVCTFNSSGTFQVVGTTSFNFSQFWDF